MMGNKRIDHGILIPVALAGLLLVTAFVHQDLVLSFQAPVAAGDSKSAIVFFAEIPGLSGSNSDRFLFRRRDRMQSSWSPGPGTRSIGHVSDAAFTESGLIILFDEFYSLYDRHTRKRMWSFDYSSLGFKAFAITHLTGDVALLFGIDERGALRAARIDGRSAKAVETARLTLPEGQVPIRIGAASSNTKAAVVAISLGDPTEAKGPLSISQQRQSTGSESQLPAKPTTLLLIAFDGERFNEPWTVPVVPRAWSMCREPQTVVPGEVSDPQAPPGTDGKADPSATLPPGILLAMWPAPSSESLRLALTDAGAKPPADSAPDGATPDLTSSAELGLWRVDSAGHLIDEADRVVLTQPGLFDGLLDNVWGEGEQPTVEVASGLDRLMIFTQTDQRLLSASGTRGADGRYSFDPPIDLASMSTASRTLIWGWAVLLLLLLVVIAWKMRALSNPRPPHRTSSTPEPKSQAPTTGSEAPATSTESAPDSNQDRPPPDDPGTAGSNPEAESETAPVGDTGNATSSTQHRAHAVRSYLNVQQMLQRPEVATATERAMAFGLDFLLCWGCMVLLLAPKSSGNSYWTRLAWDVPEDRVVTLLIAAVCIWIYCTVCEAAFSQTLGKRLLGLQVIREDGSPISAWCAVVRNALRLDLLVDMLHLVDLFSISVSSRHQRLGDLLAGTLVRRIPGMAPFDHGETSDTEDDPDAQA